MGTRPGGGCTAQELAPAEHGVFWLHIEPVHALRVAKVGRMRLQRSREGEITQCGARIQTLETDLAAPVVKHVVHRPQAHGLAEQGVCVGHGACLREIERLVPEHARGAATWQHGFSIRDHAPGRGEGQRGRPCGHSHRFLRPAGRIWQTPRAQRDPCQQRAEGEVTEAMVRHVHQPVQKPQTERDRRGVPCAPVVAMAATAGFFAYPRSGGAQDPYDQQQAGNQCGQAALHQ